MEKPREHRFMVIPNKAMNMCKVFVKGKTYKIQDLSGTYYTATILKETETWVEFLDRDQKRVGLPKLEIKRWEQVKP
jgi:hypothetical protein